MSAPSEPVALNSPANGAAIPPNASHGEALGAFERLPAPCVACGRAHGAGRLPPSM